MPTHRRNSYSVRPAVLVASALCLTAAACASGDDAAKTGRSQEVKAAVSCAGPRCISPTDAQRELGFLPVEPEALPEGFALYERYIPSLELSEEGREELAEQTEEAETATPSTLILDYRYLSSSPIPALTLFETRARGGKAHVSMSEESCGEEVALLDGRVHYGRGVGSLVVDENGHDFYVCPADGPPGLDIHTAYLAKGEILIEIKAFPEARVTRDDILKIAASLLRQMR